MATINQSKLVSFLKKNPEAGQAAAARDQGVTVGQLGMLPFCLAQVEAGVYTKAPGTAASVKKLRDSEGNRWELISARTGVSVAGAKKLYEESGGNAKTSYVGKGRNFSGSANKPAGRKPAAGKAAGGKPATNKRGAAAAATPKRAKTLAERRAARAGSPS